MVYHLKHLNWVISWHDVRSLFLIHGLAVVLVVVFPCYCFYHYISFHTAVLCLECVLFGFGV